MKMNRKTVYMLDTGNGNFETVGDWLAYSKEHGWDFDEALEKGVLKEIITFQPSSINGHSKWSACVEDFEYGEDIFGRGETELEAINVLSEVSREILWRKRA
jgi:hypothetical protein